MGCCYLMAKPNFDHYYFVVLTSCFSWVVSSFTGSCYLMTEAVIYILIRYIN